MVEGIKTTIPFHKKVMKNQIFRGGVFHTDFIEKHMDKSKNGGD
jgi:acetyl-CoA carboxylase biotin carboxylase subunit